MKKNLLSTVFLGLSLGAFAQTDAAFWDFNSNPNDATPSTGIVTAVSGSASVSNLGGVTNTFAAGHGNDVNTTDNSGYNSTNYPAQGNGSKTAGIQLDLSSVGLSNLKLEFYQRLSNTAANTYILQYTADRTGVSTGGTVVWTDATTYTFTPAASGTGDTWHFRTFDFASIPATDNNANLALRIVSAFDPTAGTYLAAKSTSTYAGGGTVRYDLIKVYQPASATSNASIATAANFQVVNENAGIINVPVTIANANATPTKVKIGLSTYTDAIQGTDFTWTSDTMVVPANSNGVFNFPISITDDNLAERAERIVVKLLGGLNTIISSTENYQIIYIKDNDYVAPMPTNELNMSLLTSFSNGAGGTNSAEIVAYDSTNFRLYIANSIGKKLDIVNFANPAAPVLLSSISVTPYGNINSVAVHNGVVALAMEATNAQANGSVVFMNADGVFINQVTVGAMPDMITFNKDYTKILTANEGEPSANYSVDPEGSVSVIDLTPGYAALTNANVTTIGFTAYNGQATQLRDQGIRIFSTSASVAQDLEPEYITISSDNSKAFVALQENNAMAVIDLATLTITAIHPLGYSDYATGNGMDASDQSGSVLIASAPVKGAYMPDALAFSTINGQGYIFSANEGDSREFGSVVDAGTIATLNLDATAFPDQHILKNNKLFGRLNGLRYSGDTDDDGDLDEIHTMGGRSFSIWSASTGQLVFDSKDLIEQITSTHPDVAAFFNASNGTGNATLKNRSDDKGPEPEGVSTAFINGSHYVFVSLERIGGVMTFNVNDPLNPVYVGYYNNRTQTGAGPDLGAEGIIHISANASPNGNALVILANEISSTLSVYQVNTCAQVAGAVITTTKSTFCDGDSTYIRFTAATGTTFEWLKDGQVIPTETNDTLVAETAGVYKLHVQNSVFACSDVSNEITITVNTLPTVTAQVTEDEICAGQEVAFTGTGAATYAWDHNVTDGTAIALTATETYTVTGTDANGCKSTDQITVNVNTLPTVIAQVSDATVCPGQNVIFTGSGAATYAWNNGVTNGTAISPSTAGTYTVTGTDANGCENTADVSIAINPVPTVSLGNDIVVCQSQAPVTLNAGNHTSYNWSTGFTTSTISVSNTGNYSVTVKNAEGCSATDNILVTVNACAGIEELALEANIFPNPTQESVQVEFRNELANAQVKVMDLQGKIIFEQNNFSGQSLKIDLSQAEAGIYLLHVAQENQNAISRIVKQ